MTDNATTSKPIKLVKTVHQNDFYETFLRIMLSFSTQKLSKTEIDLLIEVQEFDYHFTTDSKRIIGNRKDMSIYNITNYMKKLRDKGFIDDEGRVIAQLQLPVNLNEINLNVLLKVKS